MLPAACSKPCHATPILCEPVVCLTLPPAAAAYAELGWPALSLLAGPAANIADMLRTLPHHAPSTPLLFSHTVILSPASVVRPVFALASCESAYVVRRQGSLPVEAHPSFCQPVVLETYSHGYYYPHAPTLHSRLLRLLIDGMQLAL